MHFLFYNTFLITIILPLSFKSERFEEIRKKRDPGPGNYESKLDWVKPSFRIGGTVKETTRVS